MAFCTRCGNPIKPEAKFCSYCGAAQVPAARNVPAPRPAMQQGTPTAFAQPGQSPSPQPVPQPFPQSVPQPVPQPSPQSVPQPVPPAQAVPPAQPMQPAPAAPAGPVSAARRRVGHAAAIVVAVIVAVALVATLVYGGLAWHNRWWPFPAVQTSSAQGAQGSSAPSGGASTGGTPASGSMNLSDDDGLDGLPDVSGSFTGAGSAGMEYAIRAWTPGFTKKRPNVSLNYNPTGTGAGLISFSTRAVSWAAVDRPMSDAEVASIRTACSAGDPMIVPVAVDPILIPYRLDALHGEPLSLSAKTLAGILSGSIATWNDPAIAADNPQADLPATPITVVARSDKSSSTLQLSQYLAGTAPDAWQYQPSQSWPTADAHQVRGTSGVLTAVSQQDGTIGYVQQSSLHGTSPLPTVRLISGGAAVAYSPAAASRMADISFDRSNGGTTDASRTFDVAFDAADDGSYPLITVDYVVGCSAYADSSDGAFMNQWLRYVTSDAGQKAAATATGLAPLSSRIRDSYTATIDAIK